MSYLSLISPLSYLSPPSSISPFSHISPCTLPPLISPLNDAQDMMSGMTSGDMDEDDNLSSL